MLISDLTFIFGIIAAFTESVINFIIPGLLYIKSAERAGIKKPMYKKVGAVLFAMIGVSYFFISNYFNLQKIIGE
jgi:hypothetical protein